jgi:hypothetical protein
VSCGPSQYTLNIFSVGMRHSLCQVNLAELARSVALGDATGLLSNLLTNMMINEATEQTMDSFPDLPDMMAAGMGLTEALAFWSRMMNSADRDSVGWKKMREHALISNRAQGLSAPPTVQ